MEIQEYIEKISEDSNYEPTKEDLKSLLEDHIELRRSELWNAVNNFYCDVAYYIFYQDEYSYSELHGVIVSIIFESIRIARFISTFGYNDILYKYFHIDDIINEQFEWAKSLSLSIYDQYIDQYIGCKYLYKEADILNKLSELARTNNAKRYFSKGEDNEKQTTD